jgi:hypothetical protein
MEDSTMDNWSFMNDDAGLAGEPCDNWLVTNDGADHTEIVAIVPKTGDEEYDNDVTFPRVLFISALPELLKALSDCVDAYVEHRDGQPTGHLWPDPNHIHDARRALALAYTGSMEHA